MGLTNPTPKEILSVVELLIALICIPPYVMVTVFTTFALDGTVFLYQMSLFVTGIMCLFFGLSTWLYRAKVYETRVQVYTLCLLLKWELPIVVIITTIRFAKVYTAEYILDEYNENWYESTLTCFFVSVICGYVIAVLLIADALFLTVTFFWQPSGEPIAL